MSVVVPNLSERIVDENGRPTLAFHTFLVELARKLEDHEGRLVELEP